MNLCNGKNSIADIISLIAKRYNEEHQKASEYVNEFIFSLEKYDLININSSSSDFALDIRGSEEYYTPSSNFSRINSKMPFALYSLLC